MIGWICFVLLAVGTVCSVLSGTVAEVSSALLETPKQCVTLVIDIGGTLCMFSGLMRVARNGGLVDRFSSFLSRPVAFLVPQTKSDLELRSSVTMNLSSNFFGLGNAATPYGIQSAHRMGGSRFTRSLASFLILNTCSVQLIPSTVGALRLANGASEPLDILPAVWIVQILSCTCGILLVRFFFREAA